MGKKVFANGREISCKAGSGKTICAFPDVCMTPPQTPATPPGVPIPYPNTGMSSDTTAGSKKVKIAKKEVILKNKSHFKKSSGDEAGSAPMKGVITHKTTGKVFFNMWSMDVKFEGKNVARHLDITTHNHGSMPGNTPPMPTVESMAPPAPDKPKKKSGKLRSWLKKKYKELSEKLREYDPVEKAKENLDKLDELAEAVLPADQYKQIRALQGELKEGLEQFKTQYGNVVADAATTVMVATADLEVPPPPGIPPIPL